MIHAAAGRHQRHPSALHACDARYETGRDAGMRSDETTGVRPEQPYPGLRDDVADRPDEAVAAQLVDRDVDADEAARAVPRDAPRDGLLHGQPQHLLAELADLAGLLGQRVERVGAQQAQSRWRPAGR